MPYEIVAKHASCPASKPFAVVKRGTDKVSGCHPTRAKAAEQMRALYANEKNMKAKPGFALLFADAAPTRDGDAVAGFTGIAYSGGVVPNFSWYGDAAVDLGTMQMPPGDVPVLLNHDSNKIVGYAAVVNDGRQITVARGRFSAVSDAGKQVSALMAEGQPWQLSIGVNGKAFNVDRSKPTQVNGRSMELDTVLKNARLLEFSFVPSGADPNAYAAQLAARSGITPPDDGENMNDAELSARITALEAQVQTLTTERDTARTELATAQKTVADAALAARNAAITELFGEDAEIKAEELEAYRAMTDVQFGAMKNALLAARPGADAHLFEHKAKGGRDHQAGGGAIAFNAPAGFAVDPAGAQLHAKALQYQAEHNGTDYFAAVRAVSAGV